jgi:hypothetical protein
MTLNSTASLALEALSGLGTRRNSTSSNVLLPQPFSGERTKSRGKIGQASKACDRLGLAEHDMTPDGRRQLVNQDRAFYRLGPRFRLVQVERPTLAGDAANTPLANSRPTTALAGRRPTTAVRRNRLIEDRDRAAEPLGGGDAL